MAIEVKHGMNPGAAAAAAFAGGRGQGRAAMKATALSAQARRSESEREHERSLERIGLNEESQTRMAEAAQDRRREDIEFGYSTKQRAQFNQLSEAYEKAVDSGDYTVDELEDIRRQIDARQMSIQPVARLKKQSPYQTGQDIGQTWTSEDGRFMLSRDQNGNVKKLADLNTQLTPKDIASFYQQASNALSSGLEEGQSASPDDIEAYVDRMVKLHSKCSGGGSFSPATTPAPSANNAGAIKPPAPYSAEGMDALMEQVGIDSFESGANARKSISKIMKDLEAAGNDPVKRLQLYKQLRGWRETLEGMAND